MSRLGFASLDMTAFFVEQERRWSGFAAPPPLTTYYACLSFRAKHTQCAKSRNLIATATRIIYLSPTEATENPTVPNKKVQIIIDITIAIIEDISMCRIEPTN